MRILNPLQPQACEKHGCLLIRKRVFQSAKVMLVGDPEPAELMIRSFSWCSLALGAA